MIDALADWRVPALWGMVCYYWLALMCFLGLVCKNYHDNWFQAIGLGGVILWALGRASVIDDRETISFYAFMGACSLTLFGIGTAWDTWKHRKK